MALRESTRESYQERVLRTLVSLERDIDREPRHARASAPDVALVVGLLDGLAVSDRVGVLARAETARVTAYMVGGFVALDVLLLAMAGEPPEWTVVASWAAVAASTVVGGRVAARRLAREAHPGGTDR